MTDRGAKAYRFSTREQWGTGLAHALHVGRDGALRVSGGLSLQPVQALPAPGGAFLPAVNPHGILVWLGGDGVLHWRERGEDEESALSIGPAIAHSGRLIADRDWLWSFDPSTPTIYRHHRPTLQLDRSFELSAAFGQVRDIAADDADGLWILQSHAQLGDRLLHLDCRGSIVATIAIGPDRPRARALLYCREAARFILLAQDGVSLRTLTLDGREPVAPTFASELQGDLAIDAIADNRVGAIVILGHANGATDGKGVLYAMDDTGGRIDGPISIAAVHAPGAQNVAANRDGVWVATRNGLLRFDATGDRHAQSEGIFLTPAMLSPDGDAARGWLRAEIDAHLPVGTSLIAEFASTDDPRVQAQLVSIAADPHSSTLQRQRESWQELDPAPRMVFTGPQPISGESLAVPLFSAPGRWLWLRLSVLAAPGTELPWLRELRVMYPEVSLMQYLPAIFQGEANDPRAVLRRIVAVLETTSQSLDERIQRIGRMLDAHSAPSDWLNYIARWLDLPWDESLPLDVRRALLASAADIIAARGTRGGLELLLHCLFGDSPVRIVDTSADFEPLRIGGKRCAGVRLPALLAGRSRGLATLGAKAVLGRARLLCRDDDRDPQRVLAPQLRIDIVSGRGPVRDVLPTLLSQYVPLGVRVAVRWHTSALVATSAVLDDSIVLDGAGPGHLGDDSRLGRTRLGGRSGAHLNGGALIGFRLQ